MVGDRLLVAGEEEQGSELLRGSGEGEERKGKEGREREISGWEGWGVSGEERGESLSRLSYPFFTFRLLSFVFTIYHDMC